MHTKLIAVTRLAAVLIVTTTSTFAGSIIAGGVLPPNGGTGAISFGAAPYGGQRHRGHGHSHQSRPRNARRVFNGQPGARQ